VSARASDRLAIVTGTSAGVGAAVALQLLTRGWDVIGIARRTAQCSDPHYHHLAIDLSDVGAAAARVAHEVGPRLRDIEWRRVGLVNNAALTGRLTGVEGLDAAGLIQTLGVNVAAPIWLMGFVLSNVDPSAVVRIVNVSSGAAVRPFPGLAEYGSSKAALRMAGQVLAAELDSPLRTSQVAGNSAILSYEPGVVDTDMQRHARAQPLDVFPWGTLFHAFLAQRVLVAPEQPAGEIVQFLETDSAPRFSERRFGT
jgi:NAD(P)-dependent dehydrogenase (short-subunit alcohol dehydrogenase family)